MNQNLKLVILGVLFLSTVFGGLLGSSNIAFAAPAERCTEIESPTEKAECSQRTTDECTNPGSSDACARRIANEYEAGATTQEGELFDIGCEINGEKQKGVTVSVKVKGASPILDENDEETGKYCVRNNDTADDNAIINYLKAIINFISAAIGIFATGSLVFAGIQYITSSGDPQGLAAARSRISHVIIALIMFIFLYTFASFLVPGGLL